MKSFEGDEMDLEFNSESNQELMTRSQDRCDVLLPPGSSE